MSAETEVGSAAAEGHMLVRRSADVEAEGIVEVGVVSVCGGVPERYAVALRNGNPGDFRVFGGDSLEKRSF